MYGMQAISYVIYLSFRIFSIQSSASSVRKSIQLLCNTLQSVSVLQVSIVTLGDSVHSIQQTPAAAGNLCSAVTVSCKERSMHRLIVQQNLTVVLISSAISI